MTLQKEESLTTLSGSGLAGFRKTKPAQLLLKTRAVYWQESGDTIRITIQGLRYDILRYCKQGDILGYFLF